MTRSRVWPSLGVLAEWHKGSHFVGLRRQPWNSSISQRFENLPTKKQPLQSSLGGSPGRDRPRKSLLSVSQSKKNGCDWRELKGQLEGGAELESVDLGDTVTPSCHPPVR